MTNPEFSDWLTALGMLSSFVVFIVTMSAWASWWMGKQFTSLRQLFYELIEKTEASLIKKLEYHERHDDNRFDQLRNDLWEIRLRNAIKDGGITSSQEKL